MIRCPFLFVYSKGKSTDQVSKPVNTNSLLKWVGLIPEDVIEDIDEIAPMLSELGYDTTSDVPNYGTPDKEVQEQSEALKLKEHLPYVN